MMTDARLTFVVASTQRRGAEVFGTQLVDGLRAGGWSVDFLALADRPPRTPSIPAQPLSSSPPDRLGRLNAGVVRSLRSRLGAHRSAVVLANGSSTLQYSLAAAWLRRPRPAIAYSSVGEPLYWAADFRRRATYSAMLRGVDRVFAVSAATGRQLIDGLGVPEQKLRVLPTGVPRDLLDLERAHHGGPLRVLFLGSLSLEKDPVAAVEVVLRAAKTAPIEVRFAGEGPLAPEVAEHLRSGGMSDRADLLGSVESIRPLLQWADVLLSTSRTEGLPGVILEAAAAGIPAVAFDVGGVSDAVKDGRTGRVVAAADVEAAADALVAYHHDRSLRDTHGSAARRLVAEMYTMEHAVQRYDRALRELLAGRGAR